MKLSNFLSIASRIASKYKIEQAIEKIFRPIYNQKPTLSDISPYEGKIDDNWSVRIEDTSPPKYTLVPKSGEPISVDPSNLVKKYLEVKDKIVTQTKSEPEQKFVPPLKGGRSIYGDPKLRDFVKERVKFCIQQYQDGGSIAAHNILFKYYDLYNRNLVKTGSRSVFGMTWEIEFKEPYYHNRKSSSYKSNVDLSFNVTRSYDEVDIMVQEGVSLRRQLNPTNFVYELEFSPADLYYLVDQICLDIDNVSQI